MRCEMIVIATVFLGLSGCASFAVPAYSARAAQLVRTRARSSSSMSAIDAGALPLLLLAAAAGEGGAASTIGRLRDSLTDGC